MNFIKSPRFSQVLLYLYLFLYLTMGIYTELRLIEIKSIPNTLLEDFGYYERALADALNGQDPYRILSIGQGFLYPPPSLLIVEIFHFITPFFLKVSLYSSFNIVLLLLIVYGIAKYYGYGSDKVWYWYIICMGFAPFLELLHIGQINLITLFGIFMLFLWMDTFPFLSGMGLGLAIISKVSPILFFLYLFANRRYKVMAITIAVITIITCLSVLKYGLSPILEYPNVFKWLVNQFQIDHNSQSLVAKLVMVGNKIRSSEFISGLHLKGFQEIILSFSSFLIYRYPTVQRILTVYTLLAIVVSGFFTFYGKQPREAMFIVTTLGMMLSPNVMWYHHYVFILLPILVWMGWSRLDRRVIAWCLVGLLIIQIDRRLLTHGLLVHVFGHLSLLGMLLWQLQQYSRQKQHSRFFA